MSRRRRMTVYMMDLLATVPYYTAYLSRALLHRGIDVRVGSITYYLDLGCFQSRNLELDPGFLDLVGRCSRLPRTLRRVAKLAESVLNLFALSVRFWIRPPEILHVQYLPMLRFHLPLDYWFMRLVRWRGARVVLTVHDVVPHGTADRYRTKFTKLYRSVDQIVCHSRAIEAKLKDDFKVAPDRVHVVPHGPFFYDMGADDGRALMRRYSVPSDQQLVLWQGIIFPYKGLDLLLEAWATVEANLPNATLIVAGTGSADTMGEVRRQVKRLDLKSVVLDLRFTSTEELVTLYRAASVVVYPYRAITTSGALATGIALGKAIIATDLPVFRELLTDGLDAVLVPPGNTRALAESILRLLVNSTLRAQLETAMRAKDFGSESWKSIAEQTQTVYTSALSHPSND